MNYPRPSYLQPGMPTEKTVLLFSNKEIDIPRLDTPVTPLENFRRAVTRNNPLWAPNSQTDFQNLMFQDLAVGEQIGVDFRRNATEDYDFTDWFGVPLRWCVGAGGATNTPGTHLLEDITEWERSSGSPS